MQQENSNRGFYFSPESTLWKVNREQALLLGGGRALLLQVAHPLVAEAVYEHSYVFKKPIKRLLRTLELTLALVFGTRQEVLTAAKTINVTHRKAVGTLAAAVGTYSAGTAYHAMNPDLLMWVYATLVEGALTGYELFVGPLAQSEKEAFFDDSKQLGMLLGIPRNHFPACVNDLYTYMQAMISGGEVVVGEKARKIAPFILAQTSPFLKPFTLPASRITVALLPERTRDQYRLSFSRWEAKAFGAFCNGTQQFVPYLPGQR
jgi:uncharacterized protein (DUF2236 family)